MSVDPTGQVGEWWSTGLIDIEPGRIRLRGYEIQDLIGNVGLVSTIWLMLRGELPTPAEAALLEATMVSSVDHGPQAPSIAVARMAVSCGLPVNGALASAVNLLDDVHGGAGQQCMQLYAQIVAETVEEAGEFTTGEPLEKATERVLERHRAAGTRYLPGFGHRFHPLDPRAPRLLDLVDAAARDGVVTGRYAAVGRAVTAALAAGRARPVPMNVDGVTAVVYCELGFEPELGRGLFALSRSVGLLAHAWEQKGQGTRIKGPVPPTVRYRYTGPAPRRLDRPEGAPR